MTTEGKSVSQLFQFHLIGMFGKLEMKILPALESWKGKIETRILVLL